MSTLTNVLVLGAVGVAAYLGYETYKGAKTLEGGIAAGISAIGNDLTTVAYKNPITNAGVNTGADIKASQYNHIYTATTTTYDNPSPQTIQSASQSKNPSLFVYTDNNGVPISIGTSGGAITVPNQGYGSTSKPYLMSAGWQGVGYYTYGVGKGTFLITQSDSYGQFPKS